MHALNQSSKFLTALFVCCYFFVIISCDNEDKKLNLALELAGDNKGVLEKVLDHYSQNQADSLKLKAACFLIENMPGHFSYDTTSLYRYRPVIEKIHSLRASGFSKDIIKEQVNPIMDSLVSIYPLSSVYSTTGDDLNSIKSEFLIKTIEQSFEAYNNNPFKDSILFNDFLEYVLPYRVNEGCCLEDWRSYFISNISLRERADYTSVHQLCDSLLFSFKDVKLAWQVADQFPYIKLADYLKSQMTHCPQKCWVNCMLLRSFGIPVTTDFVPASRVHEVGHEWNAIKLKSGIYPFDPFWIGLNGEQYLKAYYGRDKDHPRIGSIQFPKVYRKTYKMNISDLLKHSINSGEEIPPLFRNPFLQDVTTEYFKTSRLEIHLIKKMKDVKYAYACVLGKSQRWVTVDYGKINKGNVIFNSLGSKNVYLPVYYKFNSLVPAAYPILINQDGSKSVLCPDTIHTRNIKVSYVAYPRPELEEYKQSFIGCTIEGADNPDFRNSQVLYQLNRAYEPGTYHIPLQSDKKYRFFRFKIRNSKIKINEIKLLNTENGAEKEIKGIPIYSFLKDSLLFEKIIDEDKRTGANFLSLNEEHKLSGNIWLGYDFKRPVSISTFEFYYVFDANIRNQGVYELLYWDFEWKSLGIKTADSIPVSYDNVPENALLMIKIHDTAKYSRPFTYSDGEQHWW